MVGILGLFAVLSSNEDATLLGQILGIFSIFAFTFLASMVAWIILKSTVGIRVSEKEEYSGMDVVDCGVEAYPEFTKRV